VVDVEEVKMRTVGFAVRFVSDLASFVVFELGTRMDEAMSDEEVELEERGGVDDVSQEESESDSELEFSDVGEVIELSGGA
jgi:hypothetical protein